MAGPLRSECEQPPRPFVGLGSLAGVGELSDGCEIPPRKVGLYPTVLSGDLGLDDDVVCASDGDCPLGYTGACVNGQCRGENSRHILRADASITSATKIDGVTIRGGRADGFSIDGLSIDGLGGGVLIEDGSPSFVDCKFENNHGDHGGAVGVLSSSGSPTFTDCQFTKNTAVVGGGAIRALECFEHRNCGDDGDPCSYLGCCGGRCSEPLQVQYGDIDHNGTVTLFDLFCVLDALEDNDESCPIYDSDIEPCDPNGTINLLDLNAVLNAFSGIDPCDCPDPTNCPTPGAKIVRSEPSIPPPPPHSVNANLTFELQTSATSGPAGGLFEIHVFGMNFNEVKAYQIALDVSGGKTGTLTVEDISIDEARSDFTFRNLAPEIRFNVSRGRMIAVLPAGKRSSSAAQYLATYTLRASPKSSGTFAVRVSSGSLVGSEVDRVTGVKIGSGVDITVTGSNP